MKKVFSGNKKIKDKDLILYDSAEYFKPAYDIKGKILSPNEYVAIYVDPKEPMELDSYIQQYGNVEGIKRFNKTRKRYKNGERGKYDE
jgi:hypothetical protein